MNLESSINTWLTGLSDFEVYWLSLPDNQINGVVYRVVSYSDVKGGIRNTGIKDDLLSISIYSDDPDSGKDLADLIRTNFSGFIGTLNQGKENEIIIQLVTFNGGFDQKINMSGNTTYQFNRDFIINY